MDGDEFIIRGTQITARTSRSNYLFVLVYAYTAAPGFESILVEGPVAFVVIVAATQCVARENSDLQGKSYQTGKTTPK